ncbi:MAG: CHASE domain-containing protein [Betaproteobacteria bacterium]|nr:CHASE domain-containing protein [Betaproteobacteria bacterium]
MLRRPSFDGTFLIAFPGMRAWRERLLAFHPVWIAALVFLFAGSVTVLAWRWLAAGEVIEARRDFEHTADAAISLLESRLRAYDETLRAAGAFHRAAGGMTRKKWNTFVDKLDLPQVYPGIQALAYSSRVAADDLPQFIASHRAEGQANYTAFPHGARPYYQLVEYVFPETPLNLRALGYDMATHALRRAAMDAARDQARTAMSGKIRLIQDDRSGQTGFLMFHPLYRGDSDPPPEQRRERLTGFVVAAFRVRDFMLASFAEELPSEFSVRIFDAAMPLGNESLMFDSDSKLDRNNRLFHYESVFSFGGHAWQLSFDSTPVLENRIDHGRSRLALQSGLLITLLLTALAWTLSGSRELALRRAREMTVDLRAGEERFRRLSELSSDWFWEQDSEFRFVELPRNQSNKGGLDTQRVLGLHRWDLPIRLSPEQWAAHRAVLEAHLPFRDFEYQIQGEDGPDDLRWISISGEPLFDGEGRFTGYSGVGKNITERRHAGEELKQHRNNLQELVGEQTADLLRAKRAAESANQAKSEFLANMSHELRTPMHAILSFARIGIDKTATASPEKISGYFSRILMSGERLLVLINGLLDLSKLEAGKMAIDRKPVDLAEIVREALSEFEALSASKFLHVVFEPPAGDTYASMDALRISQVVRNLLSNAIKFSPPESRIRIMIDSGELHNGRRAQDQGVVPAIRLRVVDAGVGIPKDELLTVFDKFTQSGATRTGAGGTGLGLAICKEIVTTHRGSIRAYNNARGGATFEVLLPRSE